MSPTASQTLCPSTERVRKVGFFDQFWAKVASRGPGVSGPLMIFRSLVLAEPLDDLPDAAFGRAARSRSRRSFRHFTEAAQRQVPCSHRSVVGSGDDGRRLRPTLRHWGWAVTVDSQPPKCGVRAADSRSRAGRVDRIDNGGQAGEFV